jgi:hypothetical protein
VLKYGLVSPISESCAQSIMSTVWPVALALPVGDGPDNCWNVLT